MCMWLLSPVAYWMLHALVHTEKSDAGSSVFCLSPCDRFLLVDSGSSSFIFDVSVEGQARLICKLVDQNIMAAVFLSAASDKAATRYLVTGMLNNELLVWDMSPGLEALAAAGDRDFEPPVLAPLLINIERKHQ